MSDFTPQPLEGKESDSDDDNEDEDDDSSTPNSGIDYDKIQSDAELFTIGNHRLHKSGGHGNKKNKQKKTEGVCRNNWKERMKKKLFSASFKTKMGDGSTSGFGLIFPLMKWTNDWQNQKENCTEVTIVQVVKKLPDGTDLKNDYKQALDDRDPSDARWLVYNSGSEELDFNNILESDGVMDLVMRTVISANMNPCPGFPVCPPTPSAMMNLLPVGDLVKSIIDI